MTCFCALVKLLTEVWKLVEAINQRFRCGLCLVTARSFKQNLVKYKTVFSPGYFGVAGRHAFLKVRRSARYALLSYLCACSAAQMQTRHTFNGHVAMLSRMHNKTRAFCVQFLESDRQNGQAFATFGCHLLDCQASQKWGWPEMERRLSVAQSIWRRHWPILYVVSKAQPTTKKVGVGKATWIDLPCTTITQQSFVQHGKSECHITATKMEVDLASAKKCGSIEKVFDQVISAEKKAFIGGSSVCIG